MSYVAQYTELDEGHCAIRHSGAACDARAHDHAAWGFAVQSRFQWSAQDLCMPHGTHRVSKPDLAGIKLKLVYHGEHNLQVKKRCQYCTYSPVQPCPSMVAAASQAA